MIKIIVTVDGPISQKSVEIKGTNYGELALAAFELEILNKEIIEHSYKIKPAWKVGSFPSDLKP